MRFIIYFISVCLLFVLSCTQKRAAEVSTSEQESFVTTNVVDITVSSNDFGDFTSSKLGDSTWIEIFLKEQFLENDSHFRVILSKRKKLKIVAWDYDQKSKKIIYDTSYLERAFASELTKLVTDIFIDKTDSVYKRVLQTEICVGDDPDTLMISIHKIITPTDTRDLHFKIPFTTMAWHREYTFTPRMQDFYSYIMNSCYPVRFDW